jgi:hypothetical protein
LLFEKIIIYSANDDEFYIDFYKRVNNMENIEELEILKMLEEAKEDVKNGRVSSAEGMFDEIRKKLDLNIIVSSKRNYINLV